MAENRLRLRVNPDRVSISPFHLEVIEAVKKIEAKGYGKLIVGFAQGHVTSFEITDTNDPREMDKLRFEGMVSVNVTEGF